MPLTSRGERIMAVVGGAAIVNFVSFFVIALCIGGDALNGGVENRTYYLRNHRLVTEVDPSVYWYSYIHGVSVIVTHASVFVALIVLRMTGQYRERTS